MIPTYDPGVASNSFGFGGTNACLVFDKFEAHGKGGIPFLCCYILIF
jgi:hypothetical protein